MGDDPQLEAFIKAMNSDPTRFWPDVTCELIVKAARALVEAGVLAGPPPPKTEEE